MSALHGNQTTLQGLHIIVRWDYANTTARDAATYTSVDIGGIARVGAAAPYDFYILRNETGPVWGGLGSGGDVDGPGSAIADNLVGFDGITGKLIKDTGIASSYVTAHASAHENGGSDQINVGGLSGLLADGQTPLAHAATHLSTGSDSIAEFTGATGVGDGLDGLVKKPVAGDDVNFLKGDGTWASPASSMSISTGNSVWVDAVNGNDTTGLSGKFDLPFLTVSAAIAVAASGDVIVLRPGTYSESGLTIPSGVSMIANGGFRVTIIGDLAAASHIITLSDGSYLQGFTILVPTTAGVAGVTHTTGTGTIYDLDFQGNGVAGLGDGIYKTGTGKLIGGNIRCSLGGMTNLLHVDTAVLALDDVHMPQSAGAIANLVLTEGTGRFQGQGINAGNSNLVDCIHVAGTSTCIIYSPNWFNVPIGGHLASDGITVTIVGGRVDATVASLFMDPALTGVGTSLTVSGTTVQPLFSFPAAAITAMELNATFLQEQTATRDAESRSVGASFVAGFPELGSALAAGEGSPYTDGVVVLTTDNTAASGNNGGTFVDVSTEAATRSGSTFTFQGTTAGHSILWCTNRLDVSSVPLKHWGIQISQTVAADLGAGEFIFEIQTAVNTWVEISVQSVQVQNQYGYANTAFLRASNEETIRPGIDSTTTWASTTIDGTLGHWMRVRVITGTLTTAPIFERLKIIPSLFGVNEQGQQLASGLAQWRKTLVAAGNVFGESGGVQSASEPVGSGGAPTAWFHNLQNSRLNGGGDAIYFQFTLPNGICTAFSIDVTILYSVIGTQPVTAAPQVILSTIPLEVSGNLVADPAGAVVPIPRTAATTETLVAKAGVSSGLVNLVPTGVVLPATYDEQIHSLKFASSINVSNYYEGDIAAIRLEFDSDGTPNQDMVIWGMIIEGVQFANGKVL